MTSTRYALPVAFVLLVALIPTVIHSYLDLTTVDGLSAKNINPVLGNFKSVPSNRLPIWGQETFGCYDWIERIYTNPQGKPLRLFVGRSYDHKRLYHHPELALSYARDLKEVGQERLPLQPEIPVNVLRNDTKPNMAAYVLVYDGEFVDDPIAHQLQQSLKQLVSSRKPITLFYVADDNASRSISFSQSTSAALLKAALQDFMGQAPVHE
ncbi:MAG: hypothetical protein HOP34_05840 [Methylococcaceae bacterium]|nr:hypothetical protein [Methylococcaceae bacterium]